MEAPEPGIEGEKPERGRERIGPSGNIDDGGGVDGMNRPGERGGDRDPPRFPFFDTEKAQQLAGEQEKREGCTKMTEDAGQVITGGLKGERAVIEGVSQPLDRPVEVGRGRVGEKEMLKPFRDQAPASDQRVAQDQGSIIPDEAVSKRGRVDRENECGQEKCGKSFFQQRNWVGQKQ